MRIAGADGSIPPFALSGKNAAIQICWSGPYVPFVRPRTPNGRVDENVTKTTDWCSAPYDCTNGVHRAHELRSMPAPLLAATSLSGGALPSALTTQTSAVGSAYD